MGSVVNPIFSRAVRLRLLEEATCAQRTMERVSHTREIIKFSRIIYGMRVSCFVSETNLGVYVKQQQYHR